MIEKTTGKSTYPDQCQDAGVPFFFKSWGDWEYEISGPLNAGDVYCANGSNGKWARKVGKKKAGRILDGRTWDETPEGK